MKPLFFDWILNGTFSIILFFIFSHAIAVLLGEILSRVVPVRHGVILLLGVLTATSWPLYYYYHYPLSNFFPWFNLALIFLSSVVYIRFIGISRGKALYIFIQDYQKLAQLLLLFFVLSFFYSGLVLDERLSIIRFWSNNDVWAWSKFANVALFQSDASNIIGFDIMATSAADQTPAPLLFLSALSSLVNLPVIDTLGLSLVIVLSISGVIIWNICRELFLLSWEMALLLVLSWIISPFLIFLISAYFFAQIFSFILLLGSLYLVLVRDDEIIINGISLGVLGYIAYMSYLPMAIPLIAIIIVISVLATYYHRLCNSRAFNPTYIFRVIVSLLVTVFLVVFLDFRHFIEMVRRALVLEEISAGWPYELINPWVLLNLSFTSSLDKGLILFKVLGYGIAILFLVAMLCRIYLIRNLSKTGQFSLLLLFIGLLVAYLGYYWMKGFSYQQWKFASTLILPLAFLPVATILSEMRATRFRRVAAYSFSVGLFSLMLINVINSYKYTDLDSALVTDYFSLRGLQDLDIPGRGKVVVDMQEDFIAGMITTQFINRRPLELLSATYYSASSPESEYSLSSDQLLVTNNCDIYDGSNKYYLGSNFCYYTSNPFFGEMGYAFNFNLLRLPIKTTGLAGYENWGQWSEGKEVILDIPIDSTWPGARVTLSGAPFLAPPLLTEQNLIISVGQAVLVEQSVDQEVEIVMEVDNMYFENNRLKLNIHIPDAIPPASVSVSSDPRVLGFAFHKLSVESLRAQ